MRPVEPVQVGGERRQRLGAGGLRPRQLVEPVERSLEPGGPDPAVVVGAGAVQDTVAEPAMLAERRRGRKRLPTVGTLDLLAAVGVHPLVSAEVRELGVGLEADFTLERLDAAVDVLVLFETARRRERLQITSTIIVKIT